MAEISTAHLMNKVCEGLLKLVYGPAWSWSEYDKKRSESIDGFAIVSGQWDWICATRGFTKMDEETKALLRSIAHHLKWVIVLLFAIIALLINQSLGWKNIRLTETGREWPELRHNCRVVKKHICIAISTAYHLLSVSQCLCILPQMRLRIGW